MSDAQQPNSQAPDSERSLLDKPLPEAPKLRIVRAAACDLTTGITSLTPETFLLTPLTEKTERASDLVEKARKRTLGTSSDDPLLPAVLQNAIILRKHGIVCAVFEQTVMDEILRKRWFELIEEHLSSAGLPDEQGMAECWSALIQTLDQETQQYARRRALDEEAFQALNGVIAWIRAEAVYVLRFGTAQTKVILNRLRAKNIRSLDNLGEYAFDVAKAKVKQQRRKENPPETPKPLDSTLFSSAHYTHLLEGNDRFLLLTSPPWMQTQTSELFRVAGETSKRESACQMVWQMLRTITNEPQGMMFVLDITPQEADLNRTDRTDSQQSTQNELTQQTTKQVARTVSKSTPALVKSVAGAVVVGAVAVASYFGYQAYKKRTTQESTPSAGVFSFGSARKAHSSAAGSTDTATAASLPFHDSVAFSQAPSAGEIRLEALPAFASFDKLQRQLVPFLFSSPHHTDLNTPEALSKVLNVSVEAASKGMQLGEWVLRPDPVQPQMASASGGTSSSAGGTAKKTRFWLVFKEPLKAGAYTIRFTYKHDSIQRSAQTRLVVLPTELRSLKTIIIPKAYYGKRAGFRAKLLDELNELLAQYGAQAQFPKRQLKVSYQLSEKQSIEDLAYEEPFIDGGPCIPAWSKKCTFTITWTHPITNEPLTLYTSREIEPEQLKPSLIAPNAFVEMVDADDIPVSKNRKLASQKPLSFKIRIKGLDIDYAETPIDADPQTCVIIRAKPEYIEPLGAPSIDFQSADTKLQVLDAEGKPIEGWSASPATIVIPDKHGTSFDKETCSYTMTAEIRRLPAKPSTEKHTLTGRLTIVGGAKLSNPLTGKEVTAANSVTIPVSIEY